MGRLASLPRNLQVDEDGELSLDALRVSVPNSAAGSMVQVEIFCTNGVVRLPRSEPESGLLTSTGTGQGVVVSGTTDRVNWALRSLVYRPDADVWGSDELSIVAREGASGGNNSNAGWNTVAGMESIIILIDPVNDPPTIDIPVGLASGVPPTALAGELLSLAGIVVHDADAGEYGGTQLVSVNASAAVEGSTVSLAMGPATVQGRLPGVLFLEGSAEGIYPSIAFRAPLHLANSALDLLQFWAPFGQPGGLYNVTITVSDNGNWGKGIEEVVSANVTIDLLYQQDLLAANHGGFVHWDTPHGALSVDEDSQLYDLGITLVADSGAGPSANNTWVDATLEVDHGLVQVPKMGPWVNRNATFEVIRHGPGSLTVSGTAGDVSAALVGSAYIPEPNFYGMETLELSVQEHLGDGIMNASVDILVFSQPDAPTIAVDITSEGLSVEVGSRLKLYGVGVQHADALDDSASGTVTLRAHSTTGSGTIAIEETQPGLWVYTEQPGGVFVARGSVSNLRSALGSGALEYVPAEGYDGLDVIALSVSADSPYGAFGDESLSLVEELPSGVENATAQLEITVMPAFNPAAVVLESGALFRTVEGSGVELAGVRVQAPGRRDTSDEVVSVSFEAAKGGVTLPGAASRQIFAEGQGESIMSLTGNELEVNMALTGAVFKANAFYNGVADIKVTYAGGMLLLCLVLGKVELKVAHALMVRWQKRILRGYVVIKLVVLSSACRKVTLSSSNGDVLAEAEVYVVVEAVNDAPSVICPAGTIMLEEDAGPTNIPGVYVTDPDAHETTGGVMEVSRPCKNNSAIESCQVSYSRTEEAHRPNFLERQSSKQHAPYIDGVQYRSDIHVTGFRGATSFAAGSRFCRATRGGWVIVAPTRTQHPPIQ